MLTKLEATELRERITAIEKMQLENCLAIKRLTESTQGIVDVWSAGRTLQQAAKWLSGFAIIATIVAWWTK